MGFQKSCVVFLGSMKNVGLLYHFCELSIQFSKSIAMHDAYDFLLLS